MSHRRKKHSENEDEKRNTMVNLGMWVVNKVGSDLRVFKREIKKKKKRRGCATAWRSDHLIIRPLVRGSGSKKRFQKNKKSGGLVLWRATRPKTRARTNSRRERLRYQLSPHGTTQRCRKSPRTKGSALSSVAMQTTHEHGHERGLETPAGVDQPYYRHSQGKALLKGTSALEGALPGRTGSQPPSVVGSWSGDAYVMSPRYPLARDPGRVPVGSSRKTQDDSRRGRSSVGHPATAASKDNHPSQKGLSPIPVSVRGREPTREGIKEAPRMHVQPRVNTANPPAFSAAPGPIYSSAAHSSHEQVRGPAARPATNLPHGAAKESRRPPPQYSASEYLKPPPLSYTRRDRARSEGPTAQPYRAVETFPQGALPIREPPSRAYSATLAPSDSISCAGRDKRRDRENEASASRARSLGRYPESPSPSRARSSQRSRPSADHRARSIYHSAHGTQGSNADLSQSGKKSRRFWYIWKL